MSNMLRFLLFVICFLVCLLAMDLRGIQSLDSVSEVSDDQTIIQMIEDVSKRLVDKILKMSHNKRIAFAKTYHV